MKPREFTLYANGMRDGETRYCDSPDVTRKCHEPIHVIERSSYDELLRAAAILAIDLRAATQMEGLGLKSLRDFEALIERHVGGDKP